ncbi:MAG: ABC transporter permease [Candidatus Hodarchaeota archaeon]
MTRYLVLRLLQSVIVTVGIVVLAFILVRLAGDPVYLLLPPSASEEEIVQLRSELGLDRPLPVQLAFFFRQVLTGDWGNSLYLRQPVFRLVIERFPATIELAIAGFTVALFIAFPLGLLAAIKRNSVLDLSATCLVVGGQAMPIFWLGLLLIILFSVALGLLPASGYGTPQHLVLPAVTLGMYLAPAIMRLVRSETLANLNQDYVRTARAKGLSEVRVVGGHVLRNALIPVVTAIGLTFGRMLGGAVVTETVFAWPGLGRLVVDAVKQYDYPVVQAVIVFLACAIILSNLVTDIIVAAIDPRIRYL